MRTFVLALALLGACADAPLDAQQAPSADLSLSQKSVTARLDELERLASRQAKQLAAAESTIKTLQTRVIEMDSQLTVLDGNFNTHDTVLLDLQSQIRVQGGNIEFHDQSIASLNSQMTVQGGDLNTLRSYAVALGGLGGDAGPSGTTDETLQSALFDTDPVTGASVPKVDGLGAALGARLRKRPEVLYAAWDDVINSSLTELANDPSTFIGAMQVQQGLVGRWLFDDSAAQDASSLRAVLNDIDATQTDVAELGRVIYTDVDPNDGIVESSIGNLQRRLGSLETSTANFVDDWQGEVAYLKIEDHMIWTASHDQRNTLDRIDTQVADLTTASDFVYGQVMYLDTRLSSTELTVKDVKELADILKADYGIWKPTVDTSLSSLNSKLSELDKRLQSGDAAVAAQASKEVKELADILKADYGIKIAATESSIVKLDGTLATLSDALRTTQGDVDAVWVEMALADDALQAQIDALSGEVCAIGDMAEALRVGDDAAALAASGRRGDVCMLSGIASN